MLIRPFFILFICLFSFAACANDRDGQALFLLGFSKAVLKDIVDLKEECIVEVNLAVAVIDAADANKIVPFHVKEGDYIEVEFDSCKANGVVSRASIPIDEAKFNSLKKLYQAEYGVPSLGGHRNHLTWPLDAGRISIVKLSKLDFVFIVSY